MPTRISLSTESEKLKVVVCELGQESNIGALRKLVATLDATSTFTKVVLLSISLCTPLSLYFFNAG